jgi:protein-tyrosine phosphatase
MTTTANQNQNQIKTNLSPLKRWILLNKYFIKISENKDIKSTATHFLLDGGLWKIPMEKYQEFLLLLSKDLINNCKYYISENRTKVFRFICDLDFYDDFVIDTPKIERIVKIIQEVVNEYYSSKSVIICGTE